jgi:hypothetical protein
MASTRVSKRLSVPRPASVQAGHGGVPVAVGGTPVEAMREDWVVEDRWWTDKPVRRRYFELVLSDGRNLVVFRDLVAGRWLMQRA